MSEIMWHSATAIEVCVPMTWTEKEIVSYVNKEIPCHCYQNWSIRKSPNKNPCPQHLGMKLIMLDINSLPHALLNTHLGGIPKTEQVKLTDKERSLEKERNVDECARLLDMVNALRDELYRWGMSI